MNSSTDGTDARGLPALIEPPELAALLENEKLVIIDTRDASQYRRGHIPGAVSAEDIFYYLCLPENGGLQGLQTFFAQLFSEAGVNPDSRVVVYEHAMDNGYGRSCRGWLLLQYLGHPQVQVLHGGFQAWMVQKLPTTTEIPVRPQTDFQPHVMPGNIISENELLARLDDPQMTLVDCRDYAEWLGANSSPYGYDYCPRKGRIPGSLWLEWYRIMEHRDGAAWFRSPETIRELCAQVGITPDKQVVVYCFKGARASAVVMALRMAGFPDVVNYIGSWNEWSRDSNLPADEEYPESIPD